MSKKNSNENIGNPTRDLPVCRAVTKPTAPPAACPQPNVNKSVNVKRGKVQPKTGNEDPEGTEV
jgi:hypothetical protein